MFTTARPKMFLACRNGIPFARIPEDAIKNILFDGYLNRTKLKNAEGVIVEGFEATRGCQIWNTGDWMIFLVKGDLVYAQ